MYLEDVQDVVTPLSSLTRMVRFSALWKRVSDALLGFNSWIHNVSSVLFWFWRHLTRGSYVKIKSIFSEITLKFVPVTNQY